MLSRDLILEKLTNIERMLSQQIDEPLDFEGAAKFLRLSKSYLYKLTCTRQIPHYKRAKKINFSRAELRDWLLKNPVKTASELDQEASDYVVNDGKGS